MAAIMVENEIRYKNNFKILQVETYRTLLLLFFWGHKKNREKYFDGTKTGLNNLLYQSKQSEFGHLISLVIIYIVSFVMLIKGMYLAFLFTTLINIFGNFYPVILQRHHRMRIERFLKINLTANQ